MENKNEKTSKKNTATKTPAKTNEKAKPAVKSTVKKAKGKSPGRHEKPITWPDGKFTVDDVVALNPNVIKLTIINRMKKDMFDKKGNKKGSSTLIMLDEKRPPQSADGKGRKCFLYSLRPVAKKTTPVTVNVGIDIAAPAQETPVETPAPAELAVS